MRKKYLCIAVAVLILLSGCEKADENNKQTSQDITESKEEESTKETQESEYSAKKADAILAEMGIKSYDIWSYLRSDTGEETDEFLNRKYEEVASIAESAGVEYPNTKEEFMEETRKAIYGRYKIEQQEPLIIKVNCKDNGAYMSEEKWKETRYAYVSPNGYLFKYDEKWYEIQGYNNYKESSWNAIWHCLWDYSGNINGNMYIVSINLCGFDKRDEKSYDEEKIRKQMQEYLYGENGEKVESDDVVGEYTYNCGELTVNAYYLIEDNAIFIGFYTILDEHKFIECRYRYFFNNSQDYYNDITEEMLREIFTIREYK